MTTLLEGQLVRELVLDDVPFKVILSPEGVRIMPKGKRKAPAISWNAILRLSETSRDDAPATLSTSADLPDSIVGDVVTEITTAREALTRAGEKLSTSKTLPAELRRRLDPDPVYGDPDQRTDWFIEPLLTPAEVATILRVSTAAVSRLPIRWISLAGDRRYRQSEIRRYLESAERQDHHSRW